MSFTSAQFRSLVAAQLSNGIMAANAAEMTQQEAVTLFLAVEEELRQRRWKPSNRLTAEAPDQD